jgi:hypothetical protein
MPWGRPALNAMTREHIIRLHTDGSCELLVSTPAADKAGAVATAIAEAAQIGWANPRVLRVRTNYETYTVTLARP